MQIKLHIDYYFSHEVSDKKNRTRLFVKEGQYFNIKITLVVFKYKFVFIHVKNYSSQKSIKIYK